MDQEWNTFSFWAWYASGQDGARHAEAQMMCRDNRRPLGALVSRTVARTWSLDCLRTTMAMRYGPGPRSHGDVAVDGEKAPRYATAQIPCRRSPVRLAGGGGPGTLGVAFVTALIRLSAAIHCTPTKIGVTCEAVSASPLAVGSTRKHGLIRVPSTFRAAVHPPAARGSSNSDIANAVAASNDR
jgi:hypothetical protein